MNKTAANKPAVKRSKKDEQKQLMVRIVCMVLVVALVVTSILAMFPSIREAIGEDVAEKIIPAAAADKLKCPAIKWSAGVLPKGSAAAESSDANEDAPDNGEDADEE